MNETSKMEQSSLGQGGSEQAEPVVEEAKHALARATTQAREQIGTRIESKKDRAVTVIGGVAEALRSASGNMKDAGPLPELANRAAAAVDRVGQMLEKRSLRDVVNNVEDYARREPAMFIGGAFAIGLLAARFLKSSASTEAGETTGVTEGGALRGES